ncbi:MAG TPA: GatB/YqeY domain-containing protein [Candidatus Tenderia electrophaga]|uniref:GatB/YqeY domain-containing protein n=1 Tax=Candidatus Tenderia electrophaga TaxID=1748243 RepID=A0A832J2R8_9GAMM|nr:GatB/YqeY domain-containing protein [Candidatus Tenderia electrophaga]
MATLKEQIQEDMKVAMRAKEKARLATIRLALAAIKQKEVDERNTPSDEQVFAILEKMVKQRRDSIKQFEDAGRQELADIEKAEILILQDYLPEQMDAAELDTVVTEIIASLGAAGPQDMGKVMGALKPRIQGRADMGQASQLVKNKLTSV